MQDEVAAAATAKLIGRQLRVVLYNPGLQKPVTSVYSSENGEAELATSVDAFYNGINHYQAVRPKSDRRRPAPQQGERHPAHA